MSDEDTRRRLLQSVLDAPDDDVPRLVYADWLTAQGDARGDFIRVQCGLRGIGRSERIPLKRREARLLRAHGAAWRAAASASAMKVSFHRGFIEEANAYGVAKNLASVREMFAVEPVRYLTGTFGTRADLDAFLETGLLARLEGFHPVSWNVKGPEVIAALLTSPDVTALENLNLARMADPEVARRIARAPELGGLRVLSITSSPLGDVGLTNLVGPGSLGRWRSLHLSGCQVAVDGLRALVESPVLAGLEYLTANRNEDLDDEAVSLLAASPDAASLRHLELDATGVTAEGARALLASESLAGLRHLALRRTPFADAPDASLVAAMRARWPRAVRV